MKFDNYETLIATAKMLMSQEDLKNSAPFVMAVAESKDSSKCTSIVAATGEQAFGLTKSILGGLAKKFNEQGVPIGVLIDEFTSTIISALAEGYGIEAVGEYIGNADMNIFGKDEEDE